MFQFMVDPVTGVASGKNENTKINHRYTTEKELIAMPYLPRLQRVGGSVSLRHRLIHRHVIETM